MKIALTLALLAIAFAAAEERLEINANVVESGHKETLKIVIGTVSRAPFPVRPTVPPARIAVLQMMANCKEEAFNSCGAKPMVPLCPKKLALCLLRLKAHSPKSVSTGCGIALKPVSAVLFAARQQNISHDKKDKHKGQTHGHMKWSCRIKHALRKLMFYVHHKQFWFGFLLTLLFILSVFSIAVIAWRHFFGRAQEEARLAAEEQRQLEIALEVSAAETCTQPLAKDAVVHIGTPMVEVVVANSSESQV